MLHSTSSSFHAKYLPTQTHPHVFVHMQVGPDFVFHVVGANKVPDTIQRLNATMVDGIVRIVVHGFVPDLKAFYNNMRVSVTTEPSFYSL